MIVLILVAPAGLLALRRRVFPIVSPDFSDLRGAFHFKGGVWTPGPRFPGGLWGLEVSSQGAVWTISLAHGGLCRLDGDHWTHYSRKEFGTRTDWLQGGFALRDEEVWGVSGEGVVRFDGQSWRLYSDALKTGRPVAVAAGRSGVWIVDRDGNLSHFDGSRWTIRSLSGVVPAAPPAGKHSVDRPPRLAMTGDGRLWLSWRGLWRLDGEAWREVRSPGLNLAEVWPIGHDTENVWLWLWRTEEVAAMTPDGRVAARHGLREMGLSERVRFDRLAASSGRIWIASSSGLLAFGGGRWTNHGIPPGCTTVSDIALAPEGSVWVLAQTRSFARLARSYGPLLAACLVPLIVICLLIAAWAHGRAENILATEQALVAAAGDLPGVDGTTGQAEIGRQAHSLRWKLCVVMVGIPFVALAADEAARRVWPGTPAWALGANLLGLVAVASLAIWLWTSRRRRSPERFRVREAMREPAKLMLIVAIWLFYGLAAMGWVNRLIPMAALARYVQAALIIPLAGLILFGREIAAVLLAGPALRAGDYDRAMRWIRRLSFGRPNAMLVEIEGRTHALANRPAEAEPCYRQALAESCAGLATSRSSRAGLLDGLGEVLKDQGRYEEAKRCLEGGIEMGDDDEASSRVDLAELLLEREAEPLKALELADEGLRAAKRRVAAKVAPWHSATRAWALALLGRRQEAEQAIERAARVRRETHAALFANTRLNVGMALLAMDQPEKALAHFRAAHEADREGKYGVLALRQLKQHGP